jgi:leader peptidase (prepilin peptidase)/N-methyltransferase
MLDGSTFTLTGFAFALGAIVGSFLNVVIYRLPRRESIVTPRSSCPHCAALIPWWANIPILSWVGLRGRCYRCRARISLRYPAVELLCAGIFAALFLAYGPGLRLVASWGVAAALIAAAFIDAEHKIIPNALTLPGIPLGLVVAWLDPPPGLLDALAGLFIAGGMLWALAAIYEWRAGQVGLGFGDVKLVAMLGAFMGLQPVLSLLVLGSLIGLAYGLVAMVASGAGRRTPIPFGPALAGAGLIHLLVPHLLYGILRVS